MKKFNRILFTYLPLSILPLGFLILCFHLLKVLGPLSLRHGDPDFIYLLSGLSMGKGQFNVGHVDNPGTPLQLIVALVTRITWCINGYGAYMTDLLLRPDFYLQKVIIFNQILIASVMFYVTAKLLPLVKNHLLLILLQLSFFTSWTVFYNVSLVIPEVLIFIPVSLLVIQLVKYLTNPLVSLNSKDILLFAMISGFGLSIKLDYAALVLVPIFIFRGWKQYSIYFGATLLSFILFAFPIISRRFYFLEWVKGLIMHSGRYGAGEANFIDFAAFAGNLKSLFNFYSIFYFAIAFLILVLIISKLKNSKTENYFTHRIIYGVLVAAAFQTLLVAKHFGLGYMTPLVYLLPFILFQIIYTTTSKEFIRLTIAAIMITLLSISFYKERKSVLSWKIPQMTEKLTERIEIKKIVGKSPFMIMDQPYDFYFQESPLLFGWFFQGKIRPVLSTELKRLYPASYVYDSGLKKFFLWGDLYTETEIIEKHETIYLYINGRKSEAFAPVLINIQNYASIDCVYTHEHSNSKLYRVTKNSF